MAIPARRVPIVLIAVPILDWVEGALRPVEMDAYRVCPPYGIYLLASVARERGHDVTIVDLIAAQSIDLDPYAATLANADLIGVAATSLCWPSARLVILALRGRRSAADALRVSEMRLRTITDHLPALVAYIDAQERYRFANRTYEDWLRMPRDPHAYEQKLYGALRELDSAGCEGILVEAPPDAPEWAAVRDRLKRACS